MVCVQLPVYNEPNLVAGAIASLCSLEWPRDRLEILVLDDSDDEGVSITKKAVDEWAARGHDVKVIRRPGRAEFKAGALQLGLQSTDAPYIAIFDVDYRPAPSFLRSTMAVLVNEPRFAFVQARLDFRNRLANWLTRAQAMELDTHFAYEQAARHWAGVPMIFNGTCGVWRREAIEQAGGWSGRSLGEDQELSFRVFAQGWTSGVLLTVHAAGELPDSVAVLTAQRRRWGTGATQVARSLPRGLLHNLSWHQAAAFLLLSLFNAASSALIMVMLFAVAAACLLAPSSLTLVLGAAGGALFLVVAARTAGAALATRVLGRPLGLSYVKDVIRMWLLEVVLLPTGAASFIRGLWQHGGIYVRTPKTGS
jgi:cellulose synthase/poly-beta-1,6-N-acetylglucosamine synthase-like glycosyltransferase